MPHSQTIDGLRRLCAEQLPGEEMSKNRIARACQCTVPAVWQIERKALFKLYRGLQRRGVFRDRQPGFPVPKSFQPSNAS